MCHQRARSAAIGSTENKSGEPKVCDVEAERRRRDPILTHEMEGLTVKAPGHLIGNQAADKDQAPYEIQDRPAVRQNKAGEFDRRDPRQTISAAGDIAPLDGEQLHDEPDTQSRQREIVLFKFEHRYGDDDGEQHRTRGRQREGHQKAGPEMRGNNAGDISTDSEERRLRQ